MQGEYSSFSALLQGRHRCLLHTCESGGLPVQLLDAAAAGVPIVAPRVGGIPELVSEETGFLVERADDISGFVRCLDVIRRCPEEAANRSQRASELVRQRHTRAAFAKAVAALFD
jgi:glycosyltransferase involved in cell wall biosynthesis